MARGRTKGDKSKTVLIKDDLIAPYVISVDAGGYILHKENDITNQRYFTTLHLALKAILKRKLIPIDAKTQYTISEYIKAMSQLRDELSKLMDPSYHNIN